MILQPEPHILIPKLKPPIEPFQNPFKNTEAIKTLKVERIEGTEHQTNLIYIPKTEYAKTNPLPKTLSRNLKVPKAFKRHHSHFKHTLNPSS